MVCWRFLANGANLSYKRIYRGPVLNDLDSGNSHICGVVNGTNRLQCWQWQEFNSTSTTNQLVSSLAVGENFVCGLLESGQIQCFGSNRIMIDDKPNGNYRMVSAGFNHACAISLNGNLDCWGVMAGEKPPGIFTSLALGENRSCGLRPNGTVACWGEDHFDLPERLKGNSFQAIEANREVFCGIATSNYSLFCWGNEILDSNSYVFEDVVPGPCTTGRCSCGDLPNYESYCGQGLTICKPCVPEAESESPPTPRRTIRSNNWNTRMVAFLVVGCLGSLSLLVMVLCFFFYQRCKVRGRSSRVHDSGPMDDFQNMPRAQSKTCSDQAQKATSVLEKKLSQLVSMGNGSHLEEFSLENLLWATNKFSDQQKIGIGAFGSVYRAILDDGRQVAIKRAEVSSSLSKRHDDKGHAFMNELEFLSRLNHKNLVRLLGFCEEDNELMLVYEYVENGSLHDHLHTLDISNLRSWAARIKVALDSARGIEYLHVYAVPQIIHRDIKSSNILLDATWTAKVSDFGLSLICPQDEDSHVSLCAAGTVGYMDPEYFRLQQLTTKSDVYSFGVVLLELLTGYKAIHWNEDGLPRNVVDFVVPYILKDEIHRVLDPKVPPPSPFEIEVVKHLGYLAGDCVMLEGKDRPSMTELVTYLERALADCLATPTLSPSSAGSSS